MRKRTDKERDFEAWRKLNFARLTELGIPVDYAGSSGGLRWIVHEGEDYTWWHAGLIEDAHLADLRELLLEKFSPHEDLLIALEVRLGLRG